MDHKIALVTGSTSGIGLGIAKKLAEKGCHIILNGFGDLQEIKKLQHDITNQYHVKTHYSKADMMKPEEITSMVEEARDMLGGTIDILVNNAGIQHVDLIEDFPKERWDDIIAVNLSSVFHSSKAVIKAMKQNKYGRIINIASAHGLVASEKKVAYVAAKHGVIGLTKVVALETAKEENLTCNAICPGWVLTPLVEKQIHLIKEREQISYEEAKDTLLSEKQPSGEFVHVEQIGEMVCYLCSDAAKSITGASLSMDGGWTAR